MKRLAALLVVHIASVLGGYHAMIHMPGRSYLGPLSPLDEDQLALRDALRRDVVALAGDIGGRSAYDAPAGLDAAADDLEAALGRAGYAVERQSFPVGRGICHNLAVEITGASRPGEIVIVGAHYDSAGDMPAANDNASGVAATLALARAFAGTGRPPDRTLRFVLFANEEPPFFQTDLMGSRVYARRCRQRGEAIAAMLSLETIGYYSDAPGSQKYPPPVGLLYPSTGDFIGFIGNVASRGLVRAAVGSFRRHARFPSEGAALPGFITGVGWSDHWAFWQEGYPALMVTDTAPFRYPYYHTRHDTPDKLDYDRMARVVDGLRGVVADLASARPD
jgi:hypothetical protein